MKRNQAIEVMDKLVTMGYSVQLTAAPSPLGYVFRDEETGEISHEARYELHVSGFGTDKVDVKKLVELADEADLDVRASGSLVFTEPDRRPEVIRTQRKHPR